MEQLKAAFDQIHAEAAMKEAAKACLQKRSTPRPAMLRILPVAMCLVLFVSCLWLYYTPTAQISIEINPLLELTVNRFNRVLRATGGNADGENLLEDLQLQYLDCEQAVEQILETDYVVQLLTDGEVFSVGVIGPPGEQTDTLLCQMDACTSTVRERQCYYASHELQQQAAQAGLSCGKYRQLLILQEADPSITAEQAKNMTMRQLRALLEDVQTAEESVTQSTEATIPKETAPAHINGQGNSQENRQNGQHKAGNDKGNRHGNRNGNAKKRNANGN